MGLGQSLAAVEQRNGEAGHPHYPAPVDTGALIGRSRAFRAALELVHRAAGHTTANILLVGETGTGKELFARAVHRASPRGGEPFVAINCAAIPETLLESELFGHEKGAFTDARHPKRGLLEVAGRGTVMLDEVSELPLGLQPKLLRVLEERKVRRLGALREYEVNCRIIAAANRDLMAAAEDGSFRRDLYYRLNVLRIDLPPLRDRDDDLELLARHFIRTICREHGLGSRHLSDQALALLRSHAWPGNVRELKNTLERAITVTDAAVIGPEHIALHPVHGSTRWAGEAPGRGPTRGELTEPALLDVEPVPRAVRVDGSAPIEVPPDGLSLETMERLLYAATMRRADGNRSLAARMLGVSRPTLIRKIHQYGLA